MKHKPMTAEEQVNAIDQLSAKLALFSQLAPLPSTLPIPPPPTVNDAPVKRGRKR